MLDVGDDQGVLQDGEMLVSRDGKLVAKVIVRTVEKDRSIANVMPGWKLEKFLRATWSRRPIRLPDMKCRAVHWLCLLVWGALFFGVSGCATDEAGNDSVRPWNTPQGWEGGAPMMNQQHE